MGLKLKCDDDKAMVVARLILSILDGSPLKDGKSILNGMTVALCYYSSQLAQHVTKDGMVEKCVLKMIASTDALGKTCFSKYINLPEEEK